MAVSPGSSAVQLRWLAYFATVAEELHFRRAAHVLHISPPTLSHQIRQLEAALGVSLFERTSRQVRLTAAGKALYARVRLGLDLLHQGVAEASALASGAPSPSVAVGFVSALASGVMPAALRRFHGARPSTRVRLEQLGSVDQLQRLAAGTLDAAFFWRIGDEEPSPPLRIRTLATIDLHVALPANHRFAGVATLELAQLADEVWLAAADESDRHLRDGFVELCRSHGFTPVVRNEATWISSLQALVAAGLGVCASPAPSVHPPGGGVVLVPLRGCTVRLVAARGAVGNPRVDRLVADVEAALSDLAA